MLTLLLSFVVAAGAAPRLAPRLAVVIDDFGLTYPKDQPDADWMSLKYPLTYAVMPASPRTTKVAKETTAAGHELIIHFPFDKYLSLKLPKDKVDAEDWSKVEAFMDKAFAQIPSPIGLNNHQSYRGTMNQPMMAAFMKRLKDKKIYFLDSRVSEKSVAYAEARKAGIPSAVNGIFLDGRAEARARRKGGAELEAAIEADKRGCIRYLRMAAARARQKGEAIAIGHHYYRGTYRCLAEELPKLQAEGIELVHASALTR